MIVMGCTGPTELAVGEATQEQSVDPGACEDCGPVLETVVLDRGIQGVLTPPVPDSDQPRVLRLTTAAGSLPVGSLVTDARWVGDTAVAVDAGGRLRLHDGSDQLLDENVAVPLAVRGSTVAYVRGEMPELEVVSIDLRTGVPVELTQGYAPAWNPTIGPDGDVVFVSGRSGFAELYRVVAGSEPELVDVSVRQSFPSSLTPPLYDGRTLVFQDESGREHLLELRP